MKRRLATFSASSILSAFLMTLWSSEALAQDRKGYHGSDCQTYFTSTTAQFDHTISGIYNRHATAGAWIACPITRDNYLNTNGFNGTVWVRVNRSNATNQALRCSLATVNTTGGVIQSDTESFAGNGWTWMSLNVTGVNTSVAWGSALMYCWIPPLSRLLSYNVPEFPNTNNIAADESSPEKQQ